MKVDTLKPELVEFAPDSLEEGVLYISHRFKLALHRCPCGCRGEVVTPFSEGGWTLTIENGEVTMQPSMLNSFTCGAHYFIVKNRIQWT